MGIEEELKEREKELDCLYRLTPLFTSYEGNEVPLLSIIEKELKNAMTYPEATDISFLLESEKGSDPLIQKKSDQHYFSSGFILEGGDLLILHLDFKNGEIELVPRERVLLESVLRLSAVTINRLRTEKILSGKNIALTELLNHLEVERDKQSRSLSTKVNSLILPILSQMEQGLGDEGVVKMKLIRNVLKEISAQTGNNFQGLLPILTSRELEICGLISTGSSTKEIATLLGICGETVERHRCTIRKKLGITKTGTRLSSFLKNM
ncbi:MAG: helix-turn-helix transcriptional regulator [Spirochaetales bacterium]|nr:helix-turn-helix transcriptional regulator [Spirochaetales bacterium]